MDFSDIKQKDQKYLMHTYGRFDVCAQQGKGATLTDADGRTYVDFTSGIGVNSLGFCNDAWVSAVTRQAGTLQHISNLYYTAPGAELGQRLVERTGYDKVFLCNSGAEANECAIKIARKKSYDKYGDKKRTSIITLKNSFHGRTVTTLAATGQDVFHDFFFPFTDGFLYANANDLDSVASLVDGTVCAVMLEFIQGEGGVIELEADFVHQVAQLCQEHDLTLIADEVQTGAGRTGKFLASEHYGIRPDVTTMAKGLGGGLPIGAVLADPSCSGVLGKSHHGTTFGGNPVVCAGANAVLDQIDDALLASVAEKGVYLSQRLSQMEGVAAVTGKGMMLGVALREKTSLEAAQECVSKGLLILTAKEKLRLLPPLTITYEELDQGLAILEEVLG